MQVILLLGILLFSLAIFVAYAKLAARIFKRASLSWGNSIMFAVLALALSIALRSTLKSFDYSPPHALALLTGLSTNLLLGGWYFGAHAADAQGQLLGWRRGMVLTLIMIGLLAVTFIALMSILPVPTP
jgi:hypothetical protein